MIDLFATRPRIVALLIATCLVWPACAFAQIPIEDARNLGPGNEVTVEGAITVPSGTFASFLFDQGFAIQDSTGGIYVRVAEDPNLEIHRRVRVTGTLIEEFDLLILVASDFEVLQAVDLIEAQEVTTGGVSEATEGLLVTVEGAITRLRDDQPFGFSIYIDDGSGETQVFMPAINAFQQSLQWGFVQVGNTIRATGYSGQFLTQYEVNPRKAGDVQYVP